MYQNFVNGTIDTLSNLGEAGGISKKVRRLLRKYDVFFVSSIFRFLAVPSEFLPIQLRGQRSSAVVDLPKFFLIPCAQEQALSTSTHGRDDLGVQDTTWIFRDSRFVATLF
jgi:hypothetical protein